MNCPNCNEYELEIYEVENLSFNCKELKQRQNLWCPGCQYHCAHTVWYKEIDRQMEWEEKE